MVSRCLRLPPTPPASHTHIWSMFCVQKEPFCLFHLSSLSLSSAQALFTHAGFYFKRDSLLILVSLPTFLQQEIPQQLYLFYKHKCTLLMLFLKAKALKILAKHVYLYEKYQSFSQLDLGHITNPVSM